MMIILLTVVIFGLLFLVKILEVMVNQLQTTIFMR
jgi:hypothetical protein